MNKKKYCDNPKSPFELYNIVKDASESTNLAHNEAEKLAEMEALWNAWDKSREASAQRKDY